MSLQQKFMKIADSALNTNTGLVERYKADSSSAADTLLRNVGELRNVKANFADLTSQSRLQNYFYGLEQRFNFDMKKYSVEFTEEVCETYRLYDKKMKNLFTEEGVRAKEIYNTAESDNSAFIAKAENTAIDPALLKDIQMRIFETTDSVVKKTNRRRQFWTFLAPVGAVLLPVVLIVAFALIFSYGGDAYEDDAYAATDYEAEGGLSELLTPDIIARVGFTAVRSSGVRNVATSIARTVRRIVATTVTGAITSLAVIVAIWVAYDMILKFIFDKRLIVLLERDISEIYDEFSLRKSELSAAYGDRLSAHLDEINTAFLMKYKPLIESAQRG
ncbi:MAG: hypothetical protein FWC70_11480 [Defluviitaleaceae bacterium]|nr:hypothetical protein [Defluviitaleaceae bacterium]